MIYEGGSLSALTDAINTICSHGIWGGCILMRKYKGCKFLGMDNVHKGRDHEMQPCQEAVIIRRPRRCD